MVSCMAFTLRRSVSLSLCNIAFSWYRSLKPSEPSSPATRFPCAEKQNSQHDRDPEHQKHFKDKDNTRSLTTWKTEQILNPHSCIYLMLQSNQTQCYCLKWVGLSVALQATIVIFWMSNAEKILLFTLRTESHCLIQSRLADITNPSIQTLHYFQTPVTLHPLLPHRGQLAVPGHSYAFTSF